MLAACSSNQLTKEQVIEYGEIGYSDIISFIVEGYQSHWDGISPEEMGLSPVYSYSSPYAGFARKDVDGDGFEELLIGDCFEDGFYALYDIYCFNKKDASLIHLASGGERDRYSVYEDGTIVENGSNSADDSFIKGYRIKKDKLVEVKQDWDGNVMPLDFEYFSDIAIPEHLCGGYSAQRKPSEEELAMFAFATDNDPQYEPVSVATQVVAGINYKFWCRRKDGGHCMVTIFKPLPGQGDPVISRIDEN